MLDEVDVERVARLPEFQVLPVSAIEVRLNLYVGTFAGCVLPARQQVASREVSGFVRLYFRRRRKSSEKDLFAALTSINITLHGEGVLIATFPVRAKTHLPHPPVIESISVRVEFRAAKKTHAIDAIVKILTHRPAVADVTGSLIHRSTSNV